MLEGLTVNAAERDLKSSYCPRFEILLGLELLSPLFTAAHHSGSLGENLHCVALSTSKTRKIQEERFLYYY